MSIENNELLLDALVYYASLSDEGLKDTYYLEDNINIGKFVDNVIKYKDDYNTVFNGLLGYTDEELGMEKIIDLIDSNDKLKSLVMVYPDKEDDTTTSSVCLVDPNSDTLDVYVIYVGNYNNAPYKYYMNEEGWIDISSWVENIMGAVESDTDEQKRDLEFYNKAI